MCSATVLPSTEGLTEAPRNQRSSLLPAWVWLYRTTMTPAMVPIAAPVMTSLAQCLLLYMRETPAIVAPPYIAGAMSHTLFGHHRCVSDVTAEAAANAAIVCPLGIDRYPSFPR